MLLNVPVRKCVRRFLIKEFGREPISVRANSDLGGILLLAFARGEWVDPEDVSLSDEVVQEQSQLVPVQLKLGDKFRRGSLSPNAYALLGNALLAHFRQALYYYTIGRRTLYSSEMSAVKLFLRQYNIPEEELTEESAIKIAQRERKERADFWSVTKQTVA